MKSTEAFAAPVIALAIALIIGTACGGEALSPEETLQQACDSIGSDYDLTAVITYEGGKEVREVELSGRDMRLTINLYSPSWFLVGKAERIFIDDSPYEVLYQRKSVLGTPYSMGDWEIREGVVDVGRPRPCPDSSSVNVRRLGNRHYTYEEHYEDHWEEREMWLDLSGLPYKFVVDRGDRHIENTYSDINYPNVIIAPKVPSAEP